MTTSNEQINKDQANFSNSKGMEEFIQKCFQELSDIDAKRKELNDEAGDMRARLKDKGVDTNAFRDQYGFFKSGKHGREQYKESASICFDALNKMDTGELFGWNKKPEKEAAEPKDENQTDIEDAAPKENGEEIAKAVLKSA